MNHLTIMGRVGGEPTDPRKQRGDTAMAKFSVATSERYRDRNGNKREETTWHNCVVWGKTAEIVHQYVHKGDQVLVEGSVKIDKYRDRDGNDRKAYGVKVFRVHLLANKRQDGGGQQQGSPPQQSQQDANPFDDEYDIPF